jgi:hypothetical protein
MRDVNILSLQKIPGLPSEATVLHDASAIFILQIDELI